MVIEQTLIKTMKNINGVSHGRAFTDNVLNRWICGLPVAHHICKSIENFCNTHALSSNQHAELRSDGIEVDERIHKKIELWLRQHSSFTDKEDLYSLESGTVVSEDVNCSLAVSVGELSLQTIGTDTLNVFGLFTRHSTHKFEDIVRTKLQ